MGCSTPSWILARTPTRGLCPRSGRGRDANKPIEHRQCEQPHRSSNHTCSYLAPVTRCQACHQSHLRRERSIAPLALGRWHSRLVAIESDTQGFKLESSDYVGQQISIQINPAASKHKKRKAAILGIVVSVGSSLLEVCIADGTKMHIDVNTNSADQQDVEWLIDFQETRWLNDSHVQWDTCEELVQGARKEWLENDKELFPLEEEAEAIVKALITMLDPTVELDADVIKSVQAKHFRKVPAQQGSLLKDALDVLESLKV